MISNAQGTGNLVVVVPVDKNRQAFNCLSNLILLQTCVDSYLAQQ